MSSRSDSGFSLFEALVASTLLALLSIVLFGGVTTGVRVMDTGLKRTEDAAQLVLTHDFLRNHLAQAQPVITDGSSAVRFIGHRDRLVFVDPSPEYPPLGNKLVTVELKKLGGALCLVASWEAEPQSSVARAKAVDRHESALLEGFSSAEFSYFGTDHENRGGMWHSEWNGQRKLPSLVRLRIAFRNGDSTEDLIVGLRLGDGRASLGPGRASG